MLANIFATIARSLRCHRFGARQFIARVRLRLWDIRACWLLILLAIYG